MAGAQRPGLRSVQQAARLRKGGETMAIAAKNYNPGFLTDDELREMFCVRVGEFESLVETLRENTGESNKHAIVIGPRGSGKTTLLLRVALEVRSDPALLVPAVSDRIRRGELLGRDLRRVLAGMPVPSFGSGSLPPRRTGPSAHSRRRAEGEGTTGCFATAASGALLDFAERQDKRLVLHVENLSMLFSDMMDPRRWLVPAKDAPDRAQNHDDRERHEQIRGDRQAGSGPLRPLSRAAAAAARSEGKRRALRARVR